MRNDIDTQYFKNKLEEEKALLEEELSKLGTLTNDEKKDNWEAKAPDMDTDAADDTEIADKMEEFEEGAAVMNSLELKFRDVKVALDKIGGGGEGGIAYGICEICSAPIEKDRLEANPAARTCKAHMNEVL